MMTVVGSRACQDSIPGSLKFQENWVREATSNAHVTVGNVSVPAVIVIAGFYILENTLLLGEGKISANVIWGKQYEKAKRKEGKWKRKRKKGERK